MQHRGISILGEHTSFWHPQTTYCEYPVKNFWLLGQRGGLQFLGIICHFGIFRHHIEYLEKKLAFSATWGFQFWGSIRHFGIQCFRKQYHAHFGGLRLDGRHSAFGNDLYKLRF